MATKMILVDDLDGSESEVQTRNFAIDGRRFEIDLSEVNAKLMREAMQPFIEAAREVKSRPKSRKLADPPPPPSPEPQPAPPSESISREERQRIRAWAEENSIEVAARGRFPKEVVRAYQEAHAHNETGHSETDSNL